MNLKILLKICFSLTLLTPVVNAKEMISYWSYNDKFKFTYPIPGSFNEYGNEVINQDMQDKLNYLSIIAYGFLSVNQNGSVHFNNSHVDLSLSDDLFCHSNMTICLDKNKKYIPKLGNFSAFLRLQNKYGNLKKIISIGGANSAVMFENAVNYPTIFSDSVSKIINHYNLDGIDLDFEPNTFTTESGKAYAELVSILRHKLGSEKIIIVTVAADQNINKNNWKKISENVSFVSDMCYDFHVPFYRPFVTGYNSNLYTDSNEPKLKGYYHISCDQSIKQLIYAGVQNKKIILGYPSYALAYGGVYNGNHGMFQEFDPHKTPDFDKDKKLPGRVQYRAVLSLLHSGFHEHASYNKNHISSVWAYNPKTQELLTYDNKKLVKEKALYVKNNQLAGLMTWIISDDLPVESHQSLLKVGASQLKNFNDKADNKKSFRK